MTEDQGWIDGWLREWARWVKKDKDEIARMVGIPARSAGFSTGGGSSVCAFDEMVAEEDLKVIRELDRIIDSLSVQYRIAIENTYVIRVWKMRRESDVLMSALDEIAARAVRKGVLWR